MFLEVYHAESLIPAIFPIFMGLCNASYFKVSLYGFHDSGHGYELSWFIPKICAGFTLTILFYGR